MASSMLSSNLASGVIIASIPIIQIGVVYRLLWVPGRAGIVARGNCSCSCFDGVFKGSYEAYASKHGYKHVYFNATSQTMFAWIITIVYILLGYEALKTFVSLILSRSLRPIMALLFCLGVYPHIFGWWALFNYVNDDFYPMFNHQVYFGITELISSYAILKSCDSHVTRQSRMYGVVIGTSVVHVLVAGPEEFVVNLISGKTHQFWRDVGLASSDLLNFALPVIDFRLGQQDGLDLRTKYCNVLPKLMSTNIKPVLAYCLFILALGYLI